MSGKTDEAKGRIKEAAGAITDDDKLRREGKIDQAAGKVKQAAEKTVEKVKQAAQRRQQALNPAAECQRLPQRRGRQIRPPFASISACIRRNSDETGIPAGLVHRRTQGSL